MKAIKEQLVEALATYVIYKFEYKGDVYKVLLEETEQKGNSHIYPISKNDDTSIKELPFYIGMIDASDVRKDIKNFKYVTKLTDEDYAILSAKWPFVKMFKNKSVNLRTNWGTVDKSYVVTEGISDKLQSFFDKLKKAIQPKESDYIDIPMSKPDFGALRRKYNDRQLKGNAHCSCSGFECWVSEPGKNEYGDTITMLTQLWRYFENTEELSVYKHISDYMDDEVFQNINN